MLSSTSNFYSKCVFEWAVRLALLLMDIYNPCLFLKLKSIVQFTKKKFLVNQTTTWFFEKFSKLTKIQRKERVASILKKLNIIFLT